MSLFYKNSTINWCEDDYYYSNYIAEMYNSLTGFFLCGSSFLFYYNYKNINSYKQFFVYLYPSLIILFFVGVGTFLFHSTLLYVFQLLDELPMLLLCIEYDRILSTFKCNRKDNTDKKTLLNMHSIKMQTLLCIVIATVGFINDTLQVLLFQLTILTFVIIDCKKLYNVFVQYNTNYNELLIHKKKLEDEFLYNYTCLSELINIKKNIIKMQFYNIELKYSLFIASFTSISSIIVWKYDQLHCNSGNSPEYIPGHAAWHILTSICLYYINKIILVFLSTN